MLDPKFAILAALIELTGASSYARDTFRGTTQPNRVTWVIWTIAPFIALAAQLNSGVGWPALITFAIGFGPLLVLTASFANKKAYWRLTKFDLVCGALSVLALILWAITGTGLVAIALSLLADLLASVPTIVKAYRQPETESANAFLVGILGPGLILLTLRTWDFASYSFPLYALLDCGIIFIFVKFPKWRPLSAKEPI